jgi:hypothetical protein
MIEAQVTDQKRYKRVDNILTDELKGSGPFTGNLVIVEKTRNGFYTKSITGEMSGDFRKEYGFILKRT